jgi:hypothetical protein
MLFNWLVERINSTILAPASATIKGLSHYSEVDSFKVMLYMKQVTLVFSISMGLKALKSMVLSSC